MSSEQHADELEAYLSLSLHSELLVTPSSELAARKLLDDLKLVDLRRGTRIVNYLSEFLEINPLLDNFSEKVQFGRFSYNPQDRIGTGPYRGHEQFRLSPIQGDLFHLLLANGGHTVTRDRLTRVWEMRGRDPESEVLNPYMTFLRRKIGDHLLSTNAHDHKHIRSLSLVGFGFYDDLG